MIHFAGKAVKVLLLSSAAVFTLSAAALAADTAVEVGAVSGSDVRLRQEASTSSSILATLDKGAAVAVVEDNSASGWYKIAYAGSTGYLSSDYLVIDQDGVFTSYGCINTDNVNVRAEASTESASAAVLSKDTALTVTGFSDGWYSVKCQYGTTGYVLSDFVDLTAAPSSSGSKIVSLAKQYMGVRYSYGGASPSGFDCSGFTMYIYRQFSVSLPHTATGQWQSGAGARIYSISALQPGDLVFFNDPSRNAGKACSHAGIYIGDGQFIHASSSRSGGVIVSELYSGYYNTYFVGGLNVL